jgi:hypothetical protein
MSPRTTAPARRRARSFRLGEQQEATPLWRRVLPAVLAFVAGAVVFGVGGYLVGAPSEEAQMAADIRAEDAARDKVQIKELTDLARETRDDLAPVLEGLATHTGDGAAWQRTVDAAARKFDDPPSGTTATNVARGSLTAAIDQLALAVAAHQKGDHDLATRQRDLAVTTWSIAATQLDQINVDAGYGHQHVYLQSEPGGDAFTPDGEPEGHGHK